MNCWTAGLLLGLWGGTLAHAQGRVVERTEAQLRDQIRGGWAAQVIGVTYGGPTEFQYNGTFIQDYEPIPWYDGYLRDTFMSTPGLYDDIYVDLTWVEVLEAHGLDAPVTTFAQAFAEKEYLLWHANQMARYNLQRGLLPPASGHWRNNPEADDIDFQIEADFAGLMSPGLPNTAAAICDTVGHIMNHGDGWYGGVFVAALYALAFVSDDVETVVREALKTIPSESTFHQTIADVIHWHAQYPEDWKQTWFEVQNKWSEDVGCPEGVFHAFNIDARLNAAYVVLGLLYGAGDFTRTLDIATRAGQDSDCNPATAAGVLGTMLGYERIPTFWKQGLAAIEQLDFPYTTLSLDDAYERSFRHALANLQRRGVQVQDGVVRIPVEVPQPVRFEQNFPGHIPVAEVLLRRVLQTETTFAFEGIGFTVQGYAQSNDGQEHVLEVAICIDGALVETTHLPTSQTHRKFIPFWRYELPDGPHTVRLQVQHPSEAAHVWLERAIVYGSTR
jgi:hypothetical protein